LKNRTVRLACRAIGVAGLAGALLAAPAAATDGPVVSEPIVDGLAGPLQFEVARNGTILVGQSFSGNRLEGRSRRNGHRSLNDPGVDGVSDGAFGTVIYTHTDLENGVVELRLRTKLGQTKTIASTLEHERDHNPDSAQGYGLQGLRDDCAAQLPPDAGLLPYTGIVDSHAYAVTPALFGWLVADAGANDILFVDWFGHVKTVAVLPAQDPIIVTQEAQEANELPPCTVGAQYVAEAVPTDVEIGFDGSLYVSTLPGGPEDPSLGARGGVYKVDPWTGDTHMNRQRTGRCGQPCRQSPWRHLRVRALRQQGVEDRRRCSGDRRRATCAVRSRVAPRASSTSEPTRSPQARSKRSTSEPGQGRGGGRQPARVVAWTDSLPFGRRVEEGGR
jgi:hypothetical protein